MVSETGYRADMDAWHKKRESCAVFRVRPGDEAMQITRCTGQAGQTRHNEWRISLKSFVLKMDTISGILGGTLTQQQDVFFASAAFVGLGVGAKLADDVTSRVAGSPVARFLGLALASSTPLLGTAIASTAFGAEEGQ